MRLHVTGSEHVPTQGPALLVSNHLSTVDPLIIGVALSRELRILAKAEVFAWPIIGPLARWCEVVPIRRGQWDVAALRIIAGKLQAGHAVLIFPEGTYAKPPHPAALLQFKIGAAWLAARVQAPVTPVAVWGSERVWTRGRGWRLWRRPHVYVHFGEPYIPQLPADLARRDALQPVADEMARLIRDRLPKQYHGYYRV
jgi:1-acyl-sn-glycerol-3-phosphate acyltransferase